MRILVIGGTRFIGPHVVRQLAAEGHDLAVFHRGRSEAALPESVQRLHGDRRDLAACSGALRGFAPDIVLDMVAFVKADAAAMMALFRGVARRAVVASSEDVYRAYDRFRGKDPGPPDPVPLTEDSPLRERLYPYRADPPRAPDSPDRWLDDYEKILVERTVLRDPELPGTVLRLPAVYGSGDPQHRLFHYLKRMDDGRPFILLEEGVARWRWSRGYVENVAAAIALAVVDERAAGRIYNVAEPEALTEADWIRRIGEAAGWRGEVLIVPDGRLPDSLAWWRGADARQDWTVDTGRIRRELGYREPVRFEEGLRRTVAWERAHPPQTVDPRSFDYAAEDALLRELRPAP